MMGGRTQMISDARQHQYARERQALTGLLNPDLFVQWLEEQDAALPVGIAVNVSACPLAAYLHDHGLQAAAVTPHCVFYFGERVMLPQWAQEFVSATDSYTHHGNWCGYISKSRALAIMHDIGRRARGEQ